MLVPVLSALVNLKSFFARKLGANVVLSLRVEVSPDTGIASLDRVSVVRSELRCTSILLALNVNSASSYFTGYSIRDATE